MAAVTRVLRIRESRRLQQGDTSIPPPPILQTPPPPPILALQLKLPPMGEHSSTRRLENPQRVDKIFRAWRVAKGWSRIQRLDTYHAYIDRHKQTKRLDTAFTTTDTTTDTTNHHHRHRGRGGLDTTATHEQLREVGVVGGFDAAGVLLVSSSRSGTKHRTPTTLEAEKALVTGVHQEGSTAKA